MIVDACQFDELFLDTNVIHRHELAVRSQLLLGEPGELCGRSNDFGACIAFSGDRCKPSFEDRSEVSEAKAERDLGLVILLNLLADEQHRPSIHRCAALERDGIAVDRRDLLQLAARLWIAIVDREHPAGHELFEGGIGADGHDPGLAARLLPAVTAHLELLNLGGLGAGSEVDELTSIAGHAVRDQEISTRRW